jgi:hypothetical protein
VVFCVKLETLTILPKKINVLAEDKILRKEMGDYNRSKVERLFTMDRMVKEYQCLFESVMNDFYTQR